MNEEMTEQKQSLEPQTWNEYLDKIQHWTFADWNKPEMIGPTGQSIHVFQTVKGQAIEMQITRYLHRVDIDVTQSDTDGHVTQGIYKDVTRDESKGTSGLISFDMGVSEHVRTPAIHPAQREEFNNYLQQLKMTIPQKKK